MGLEMFLEMILAAESLVTSAAGVRSEARMDQLVASELFIACKGFVAVLILAPEWSFSSVDSGVIPELTII